MLDRDETEFIELCTAAQTLACLRDYGHKNTKHRREMRPVYDVADHMHVKVVRRIKHLAEVIEARRRAG